MSQREKEPRVLSPLSARNGNPTCPEPIRCVLLMRVLPHLNVRQRVARCEPSISQRIGRVRGSASKWAAGSHPPATAWSTTDTSYHDHSTLPRVTVVSLILPDQLFLLNSHVGHNEPSKSMSSSFLFAEKHSGQCSKTFLKLKSTSLPSTMREVFEHCAERLGRRKNRHVCLPESQPLSRPSRSSGKAVREDSGLRAGHTVRYGPPACP